MKIDRKLLNKLSQEAKKSPRLRINLDMRNTTLDNSQRMLNALEPGTVLPIHRHPDTSETVIILRGKAVQYIYDNNGNVADSIFLEPNTECSAMNVPLGVWHRLESLATDTIIFEAKDGSYKPLTPDNILTT